MPEVKSEFVCANCGQPATEGSMKHPYCADCFRVIWHDDYIKYEVWLAETHM